MEKNNTPTGVIEKKKKDDEDICTNEVQEETELSNIIILTKVEPEAERTELITPEDTQIVEFEGEPFDPLEHFSVLILTDVTQKVKQIRTIPAFLHINKPVTIIGNGKRAHFKVDDFETVRSEHGAIVFKDGHFYIFPHEGKVDVNGKSVVEDGEILNNGSRIEMGSAKFIFLTVLNNKGTSVFIDNQSTS